MAIRLISSLYKRCCLEIPRGNVTGAAGDSDQWCRISQQSRGPGRLGLIQVAFVEMLLFVSVRVVMHLAKL